MSMCSAVVQEVEEKHGINDFSLSLLLAILYQHLYSSS